jgi:hypothetical protein
MADTSKYKSVSVPIEVYKILTYLSKGKLIEDNDMHLTISKTIELLAKRTAKESGYRQ